MNALSSFSVCLEFGLVKNLPKAMLSLICSTGCVGRLFKARSHVSRKEMLRLGQNKIDTQRGISLNSSQGAITYLSNRLFSCIHQYCKLKMFTILKRRRSS